jgi:hypothetical protein
MVAGGDVDVSYLGPCAGYATAQPDFRVEFTAGSANLLRFYFEGGGDPTLVINDPDGEWWCDDDSPGTTNPMIDFGPTPISGTYNIWVGAYSQAQSAIGTLYITELESNHP